MGETQKQIGTILCNCSGTLFSRDEADQITARMKFEVSGPVYFGESLCGAAAIAEAVAAMRKRGVTRVAFAGCSAARNARVLGELSRSLEVGPSSISAVDMRTVMRSVGTDSGAGARVERAVSAVRRHVASLGFMGELGMSEVSVTQRAVVIGGGLAAWAAAAELAAFGHDTVLVDPSEGGAAPDSMEDDVSPALDASTMTVLRSAKVTGVDGSVGNFRVTVSTVDGTQEIECGAVVVAAESSGAEAAAAAVSTRFGENAVPLSELSDRVRGLRRVPLVRTIALVLDMEREETKAGTEAALETALAVQRLDVYEVFIFCREARVASLALEGLYDAAREAGVTIVKHDGKVCIAPAEGGKLAVSSMDAVLGRRISVACDLVGISPYGIDSSADPGLSELAGILRDDEGQMQVNNIHLFPAESNRPGVYLAGPATGRLYAPEAVRDARAAALAAHELLESGTIRVETANAVVDADKCALCLTCIRACPYDAMVVNAENGAAESLPQVCQRCGMCAGECPAKAIELPAYTDAVLMARL